MKTAFHRQSKNRAESEQERVKEGVGEMGSSVCVLDSHRLPVCLCGQRNAMTRIPEAESIQCPNKKLKALMRGGSSSHPTYLCTLAQTLLSPRG